MPWMPPEPGSDATRAGLRLDRNVLKRLVEKPVDVFLEYVGDDLHQFL
jgi:hypothetical protein